MKKLLSAVLAVSMIATCAVGFSACGKDSDTAKEAIKNLKELYDKTNLVKQERDYEVLGQTKVGDKLYDVDWTVSWESTEYSIDDYIKVGDMNEDTLMVTISVTRPAVELEYKLTASVTVGKATESYDFTRKVPAKSSTGATKTVSIVFDDKAKRTTFTSDKQVWEQNGIKVTNTKGSTNIGDYLDPVRFYKGSTVKIEYPGMKNLEIDCTYEEYATAMESSLKAANVPGTVKVTSESNAKNVVSVALSVPVDYLEFVCTAQARAKAIDIDAVEGGATDEDKAAAAASMVKLDQTVFASTGDVTLPGESYGATLSWSVKETTDLVSIANGKLTIAKLPTADTNLTLVVTAKVGTTEKTAEITITLKPAPSLAHAGTEADPFSTTDVLALAATLGKDAYYRKDGADVVIYVEGYVIDVGEWSADYSNWTRVYIAGSVTSTTTSADALMVYRLLVDNTYLKASTDLVVGAKIVVKGVLQNYAGNTPEVTYNGSLTPQAVSYTKPQKVD